MFNRYHQLLHKYPYRTNAFTAGTLWCAGDLLAQKSTSKHDLDWQRLGTMTLFGFAMAGPIYTAWYGVLEAKVANIFKHSKVGQSAIDNVSKRISLVPNQQIAKYSTLVVPKESMRYSLGSLSDKVSLKWKIALTKTLADLIIFDPPYLSFFFVATNAMQGHSLAESRKQLKQELVHTYKVDVAVWTPIQIFNFRFIPVVFQPLLVNSVNVGWNAYLSFVKHR
jgi:hypothetical protein